MKCVKCSDVEWTDVIYVKRFCFEVKWVTLQSLGTKVPCTVGWPYIGGIFIVLWLFHFVCVLYCGCFNLFCNVWVGVYVVVCVWVCVCVCVCVRERQREREEEVSMCGCFDNSVGVSVMCTCIYCILYCLYCVFVLFRLCIFILICCVCTSVRTIATEWKLNCSK